MTALRLFVTLFVLCCCGIGNAQVYVALNGSDTSNGSKEKPFASLQMALRKVREMRRLHQFDSTKPISIVMGTGRYELKEPVFIRPEDAGTVKSPTIISSADGQAVLSGGIQVGDWQKAMAGNGFPDKATGKVWVADAPVIAGSVVDFRQLWINDKKAVRAKTPNGDSMYRIFSWNKQTGDSKIPASGLQGVQPDGVEMFIHQWWATANLRLSKAAIAGDTALVSFHEPENRIQKEHPWPSPWLSKETGNSAYYLVNAPQFLDEPGEWYLDKLNRKIYYWPKEGEDLTKADVIIPYLETLVKAEGTNDHPLTNISFVNIGFEHAGWLKPSREGNVPHQAGMPMTDAYKLKPAGTPEKQSLENQAWITRPGAAVVVNWADNIRFEHCSFQHIASTALDFNKGTHHNTISGNLFADIGGTAILAGLFADEATEIHLPYNPSDKGEVTSNITISNNLITNATNEDWGCVGIGAGYVANVSILHNEIEDVAYSGISVGWGWSPQANAMHDNKVQGNYIHHYGKHNYDCAGIYTLSAQPNTVISENVVDSIYKAPYAHLPSHWFYLYTDEGSSYITVKNNWTPAQKYLQNANGTGNTWKNNGPQVSAAIKLNAGLEQGNAYLKSSRSASLNDQPINFEHREVIELVFKSAKEVKIDSLKRLLQQQGLDPAAVFQWKNHVVVFDHMKDIGSLQHKLQNAFPAATARPYYNLVYEFDRSKCGETVTEGKWKDYMLTASLVEDPAKQAEYIAYHETQYEKWPEVAKGFCNADFQQLMVFRNERQLVLIISIPEGKTLDELNPKTAENNPRVDEWNKIMAQYQQGIPGTKKGETWVFLEQVKD